MSLFISLELLTVWARALKLAEKARLRPCFLM